MNVLAGFAPLFALLLLAVALILYWPAISDWREKKQIDEKHSNNLRLRVAHTLSSLTLLLVIFSFAYHDETTTDDTEGASPQRVQIPPRDVVTPAKQKPEPTQTKTHNLQVVAMSQEKIAIIEDGNIITLKPSQKSPRGWKLISSTTLIAKLIAPNGKKVIYHSPPPKE